MAQITLDITHGSDGWVVSDGISREYGNAPTFEAAVEDWAGDFLSYYNRFRSEPACSAEMLKIVDDQLVFFEATGYPIYEDGLLDRIKRWFHGR